MTINTTAAREMLIKELKLDGFTEAEQQEIIDMLEENIVVKINNDIFGLLDTEDRQTFLSLAETKDNEQIGIFLKAKIPDMDGLIKRAAQHIIRAFKEHTA
jgi:hypothetical protein